MDGENPWTHVFYQILASIAGAITALSFRAFNNMTRTEIAVALFVSASFGFFMGPLLTQWVFGEGPINLRLQGALYFLLASGSNILIPTVIKRAAVFIGNKDGTP